MLPDHEHDTPHYVVRHELPEANPPKLALPVELPDLDAEFRLKLGRVSYAETRPNQLARRAAVEAYKLAEVLDELTEELLRHRHDCDCVWCEHSGEEPADVLEDARGGAWAARAIGCALKAFTLTTREHPQACIGG